MFRKFNYLVLLLLFCLATEVSKGEIPVDHTLVFSGHYLQLADSLYQAQDYERALDYFSEAHKKGPIPPGGPTSFKIAFSLYRTNRHFDSATLFRKLYEKDHFLEVYSAYFYIRSLWNYNPDEAVRRATEFVDRNKKHFLSDSLILRIADHLYEAKSYGRARDYYLEAVREKIRKNDAVIFSIRAADCLYRSGKQNLAKDEYDQILNRYENKAETLELAHYLLQNEKEYSRKNFFKIVDVYFANREYEALRTLLENYVKTEALESNKEKARYHLLTLYYATGQYKTALYGFKNFLDELKNSSLEPRVRLYIARSHYQLGQKSMAVQAYTDYADRFPRRRIAAEAMWKAAWISEELNDTEGAFTLYRELRMRWPGSSFTREAHFREGFTLYRLGRFDEADLVFNDIRFRNWPSKDKHRAQYWASLCRDKKGDTVAAKRLRVSLAGDMWDDYYTMKSYLMHKTHLDSTWDVLTEFRKSTTFLTCHTNGFASLLPYFDEVFQVYELLGEEYAFGSIENVKLVAKNPEEWISLAEIYKQFRAYNKSFRTYSYIDSKFYAGNSYAEKIFLLKERFPFYYDQIVEKYAARYGLEKEFIFAIMKQESAFDPRAQSWANAYGLMQLIRITAQDMGRLAGAPLKDISQLMVPDYNIHLGSLYVKQLSRQLERKEWILAAYNAGPHRVKRWRNIPGSEAVDVFIENIEFQETRNYVRKVMTNYWAYRLLKNGFRLETDDILLGLAMPEENNH